MGEKAAQTVPSGTSLLPLCIFRSPSTSDPMLSLADLRRIFLGLVWGESCVGETWRERAANLAEGDDGGVPLSLPLILPSPFPPSAVPPKATGELASVGDGHFLVSIGSGAGGEDCSCGILLVVTMVSLRELLLRNCFTLEALCFLSFPRPLPCWGGLVRSLMVSWVVLCVHCFLEDVAGVPSGLLLLPSLS